MVSERNLESKMLLGIFRPKSWIGVELEKMRTMALDMSTKSTGVAIFNGNTLESYKCIVSNDSDSFKRIKFMTKEIETIYEKENIDEVIIEDVIPEDTHNNLTVFKALHYLQAYVVLMFHDHQQSVNFFVSSEWRKICGIRTGRGVKRETLKAAAMQLVKDNYNLDVNDDISDAICIGWAFTTKNGERPGAF